ncbi:unnamed protein product [Cyprideis torosa]|uniref:Uncharacterized protein n=1 Tax=Cyprideis torosa TaxID=163714 RepID=A0A7R8W4T3_9CRUS|nr:unnamed protein product [Cyprideis torosa]CAG0879163.1 unnamed protein product [Cyprideis torosa]
MKLEAVRQDRMRGGRNKFGPMYKRDRARKLQLMRQRQLAIQQLSQHNANGGSGGGGLGSPTSDILSGNVGSPVRWCGTGLESYRDIPSSNRPICPSPSEIRAASSSSTSTTPQVKQELIQIPQLSSSTSSPDSSPVPTSSSSTHASLSLHGGSGGSVASPSPITPKNQTYNQCEVDIFELTCKVLDQNLFTQVDWARNSVYFKELKVDDQMKLLQNSWSEILILDHIHHRMHNNLPDEFQLPNGQKFDLLALALLGTRQQQAKLVEMTARLSELGFDLSDYVCFKFLILLNPDVRSLQNRKLVQEAHEQIKQALIDYTVNCYPAIQEKYNKVLGLLPDLRFLAQQGEEFLYYKHMQEGSSTQTLLMEMLHARRK